MQYSSQRQGRALVNLKQLSQSPWHIYQDQPVAHQPRIEEETIHTNTIQSVELPLNPKHSLKKDNQCYRKHFNLCFSSLNKQRPHTIHNQPNQQPSQSKRNKIKLQPFTSLNFYGSTRKQFNTFDDRSRLNQEVQLFATRIRYQEKLLRTIDLERAKTGSVQQPAKINFKANIAKRSFFYKQFKNFLVDSFKVDGRPVQIRKDRYSIQSHGLPKKKSIYSFKGKQSQQTHSLNKTNILVNKINRYDIDLQRQDSIRRISKSHYETINTSSYLNQTIDLRQNQKKRKGKLCLGRPPTKLISHEN